jgi:hypothetical protein
MVQALSPFASTCPLLKEHAFFNEWGWLWVGYFTLGDHGGGAIANTISNGEASYVNKTLDGCTYLVKS